MCDALDLERRLDAGQTAEDHRLVDVAEVADAKDAAAERTEAAYTSALTFLH